MSLRNNRKARTKIRTILIAYYGPYCVKCAKGPMGGQALTLDHVIPLREGGQDHPTNIQLLCVACHREEDQEQEGGRVPEKRDFRLKDPRGLETCFSPEGQGGPR